MDREEGSIEGNETHLERIIVTSAHGNENDEAAGSRNLFHPNEAQEWEASEVKEMENSMKQELRRLNHESIQFQGKLHGFEAHSMSGYLSRPETEDCPTDPEQATAENNDTTTSRPIRSTSKKVEGKQKKCNVPFFF
ncbi:hypothetical protein RFI_29096 [Reticulomyxa filosa]|uniref:Uncharacterized protein n=1 Tax=Reticulomyxa filosa TaxID=46433 RepID=X6M298_RETFI|nr:hypothetical protein RFI_29096 [Reticulomyxa filosa]|eukprot:ETO08293.1 hypothetical protein RFI_29096 [Reticulomyxa filosa]